MEKSKLIASQSATATASAPLKREGDDDNTKKVTKRQKIKRQLPASDFKDVIDGHEDSLQYDLKDYLEDWGSDWWEFRIVPEGRYYEPEEPKESYTVERKFKGKCNWGWRCDYYCQECKQCAHQFECDCEDGKEGEMCQHMHSVGRYLEKTDDEESEDEEDSESKEAPEESDDDDDDETDQRTASSMTSEGDALFKKVRSLFTGKRNADIIIQNLKSIIPLLEKNKKLKGNSQK